VTEAPRNLLDEATKLDEIEAESWSLVELPIRRTRSGQPVKVLVRAVDGDAILVALRGFPDVEPKKEGASETKPSKVMFEEAIERMAEWKEPAREIAKVGIITPRFDLDDNAPVGCASWDPLAFPDRMAVVNEIMRLSGFGKKETAPVRAFPASDGSGRSDGAPADASGEATEAPVVAVAEGA
jgi:hypothetical protein